MATVSGKARRVVRHTRVRNKISGTGERPRLAVYRSLNNIYAQIIDDSSGHTIVAASTLEKEVLDAVNESGKISVSRIVGKVIAQRAKNQGISQVVFDRGGYKYHGRVKAIAEAAREEGLKL
jgi:large subunit ribosomal protein L18